MRNHYYIHSLFPLKQVTYPTPPYMSIRRAEIDVLRPPVWRRKLMDMIKKFDPNDISYIDEFSYSSRFLHKNIPSTLDPRFRGATLSLMDLKGDNFERKDFSIIEEQSSRSSFQNADFTSIQDSSSKYFVINNGIVWAKDLAGDNVLLKAKFKIKGYPIQINGKIKIVNTLQVQNQDLYVSCKPGDSRIKVVSLGQKRLEVTNPQVQDLFFFPKQEAPRRFSFEPLTKPDWIIGTSNESDRPVEVVPRSDNRHRTDFAFDANVNIAFSNALRFNGLDLHETLNEDAALFEEMRQFFNLKDTEISSLSRPMWNDMLITEVAE